VVKEAIFAAKPEFQVDRQKLIHSGKVLKDNVTLAESGITESDFVVCMITKETVKVNSPRRNLKFIDVVVLIPPPPKGKAKCCSASTNTSCCSDSTRSFRTSSGNFSSSCNLR